MNLVVATPFLTINGQYFICFGNTARKKKQLPYRGKKTFLAIMHY